MKEAGVSFYQSFFGFSQVMKVVDAQGKVLWDGGIPLMWQSNDGTHSIGEAVLADQGLTVMVVAPASGEVDPSIKAGQVQVEVYKDGTDAPIATQVIDQGQPVEVAGTDDDLRAVGPVHRPDRRPRPRRAWSCGSARWAWCSGCSWSSSSRTAGSGSASAPTPRGPPTSTWPPCCART